MYKKSGGLSRADKDFDALNPSNVRLYQVRKNFPVSILYKYIAGRYRPVRVVDGPITARYRFIKNASWVLVRDPVRKLR